MFIFLPPPGEMIQFDEQIFFEMGGEKPPTSSPSFHITKAGSHRTRFRVVYDSLQRDTTRDEKNDGKTTLVSVAAGW